MTLQARRWVQALFYTAILFGWIWIEESFGKQDRYRLLGWWALLAAVGLGADLLLRRTALSEDARELIVLLWFGATLVLLPLLMAV